MPISSSRQPFSSLLPATALLAAAGAIAAQTTKPPVHRATTVAHKSVAGAAAKPASACVTIAALSPKIPAAPAGSGCPKSLYALSFGATHLDPQVSGPLRTSLEALNQSFSLNYIDTKIGTGELAQPRKFYTVNYTGYLLDGTKFDSSLDPGKEPFTFQYGGHRVIQGWDTGFEGMRTGGKRRLFVPYQLAYGERGNPTIPPKSVLVFDVEFLSQSDAAPTPPAPPQPPAGSTPPEGTTPPGGASTTNPATAPNPAGTPNPATSPQPATPSPAPSSTPPASAPKPAQPAPTPPTR